MNGNPVVFITTATTAAATTTTTTRIMISCSLWIYFTFLLLFLLWGEHETLVLLYSIGYSIYIGRRSMKSEFRHVDKVIRSFSHPKKGKGTVCITDRKRIWYSPKNEHSTWQEAFPKGTHLPTPVFQVLC